MLWAASVASPTEVVVLEKDMHGLTIGAALEIAEDPESRWDLQQVLGSAAAFGPVVGSGLSR